MSITDKAQIYRERFPAIIAERLASQVDSDSKIKKDFSRPDLITFAFEWFMVKEGAYFWNAIRKLYASNEEPSEQQIREVFRKYNNEP